MDAVRHITAPYELGRLAEYRYHIGDQHELTGLEADAAPLPGETAFDVPWLQPSQPPRLHRRHEGLGPQHVPALQVVPHTAALDRRQMFSPEGVDALLGGCPGIGHGVACALATVGERDRLATRVAGRAESSFTGWLHCA